MQINKERLNTLSLYYLNNWYKNTQRLIIKDTQAKIESTKKETKRKVENQIKKAHKKDQINKILLSIIHKRDLASVFNKFRIICDNIRVKQDVIN